MMNVVSSPLMIGPLHIPVASGNNKPCWTKPRIFIQMDYIAIPLHMKQHLGMLAADWMQQHVMIWHDTTGASRYKYHGMKTKSSRQKGTLGCIQTPKRKKNNRTESFLSVGGKRMLASVASVWRVSQRGAWALALQVWECSRVLLSAVFQKKSIFMNIN